MCVSSRLFSSFSPCTRVFSLVVDGNREEGVSRRADRSTAGVLAIIFKADIDQVLLSRWLQSTTRRQTEGKTVVTSLWPVFGRFFFSCLLLFLAFFLSAADDAQWLIETTFTQFHRPFLTSFLSFLPLLTRPKRKQGKVNEDEGMSTNEQHKSTGQPLKKKKKRNS